LINTSIPAPPIVSGKTTPTAKTADFTITAALANTTPLYTNAGAVGAVVFTLPAASACAGISMKFAALAAQTITLTPASGGKIWLNGSGVADKYALLAGVIGNVVDIYSDGVDWIVTNYAGVLTKQA
jgi:hypothetical protein